MSEDRAGTDTGERDALDDLLEPDDDDLEGDGEEAEAGEDEGEEEPPEQEAEAEPPPPPQRSRAERRIEALRKRAREAEATNKRLTDQILGQTRQPQAPPPPIDPYRQAEFDRQEAERVQMMAPHEVAAYYANKTRQEVSQYLQRGQIEIADRLDKQSFETIKANDPVARRLADAVEDQLIAARRDGMNPTREMCLNTVFGREMRAKAQRQADKQRTQGRRRIAAQTTRPGGNGSTAASPRGQRRRDDSDEALEARLKGVTMGDIW
jgi:hypothetical protein